MKMFKTYMLESEQIQVIRQSDAPNHYAFMIIVLESCQEFRNNKLLTSLTPFVQHPNRHLPCFSHTSTHRCLNGTFTKNHVKRSRSVVRNFRGPSRYSLMS